MDTSPLPLFPELELAAITVIPSVARDLGGRGAMHVPAAPPAQVPRYARDDSVVCITIRNLGAHTIRTRTYGQPEYRLIAKLFDGEAQVQDRWLSLPCDLAPGATATLTFPRRANGTTLRLYHALQDVPMVDHAAWAEVRDVR